MGRFIGIHALPGFRRETLGGTTEQLPRADGAQFVRTHWSLSGGQGGPTLTMVFVSGNWIVREGCEATFVESRRSFLDWTRQVAPGLHWALLLADNEDGRHFISVASWESEVRRDAWRAHADFPAHLGPCRALCDDFRGTDYSLVATFGREPDTSNTEQKADPSIEEVQR